MMLEVEQVLAQKEQGIAQLQQELQMQYQESEQAKEMHKADASQKAKEA